MSKIILASQSPRRKQLLEWAGQDFDILLQPTEESYPGGFTPSEVAVYIARNKALAVLASPAFQSYSKATPILAADTIVVLDNQIIGKPNDRNQAIEILSALSGKEHEVITGVVIRKNSEEISFAESTRVLFHPLNAEQIAFYVDHYQPYDKAGAYAIQEWIGVVGIKSITGDFYNVMGLPVSRVIQALKNL
jgi:septum formation protein